MSDARKRLQSALENLTEREMPHVQRLRDAAQAVLDEDARMPMPASVVQAAEEWLNTGCGHQTLSGARDVLEDMLLYVRAVFGGEDPRIAVPWVLWDIVRMSAEDDSTMRDLLPYLRPVAAKPSRPDPSEMSAEELEAELDAAEGCGGELLTREEWSEKVEQLFEDIFDAANAADATQLTLWRNETVGKLYAEIGNPDEDGAATSAERWDWQNLLTDLLNKLRKPSRPDPDEMDEEALEAELDAAEGVEWLPYCHDRQTGGVYHWIYLAIAGERLKQMGDRTSEGALRAAVRAVREHLDAREDDHA